MSDQVSIMTKLIALTDARIPETDKPRADRMSRMAFGAILNGPASDDWRNYMVEIVGNDSPKQLARLTLTEDKTKADPEVRRSSAYIVANGICTPDTTTRTRLGVNAEVLDQPFDD